MRVNTHVALALLAGTVSAAPAPQAPSITTTDVGGATTTLPAVPATDTAVAIDQLEQLAHFAEAQTNATLEAEVEARKNKRGDFCAPWNLQVRREWGTLSANERKAYTAAVNCLRTKQQKSPASWAPGVKGRFDDFVAVHINQTMEIHYTGTFLAWHRLFTWQYEQALRNECGYKGTQPYWDWSKTAQTGLERSPIFDGSATSMSGNGLKVSQTGDIVLGGQPGLPDLHLPTGSGGGAVTTGPFAGMQVNLGPASLSLPGGATEAVANPLEYNPRPLKRDLTDAINRRYANASSIVNLILKNNNIASFQDIMQGIPGSGDIGVHGGGHYSLGGDPGRDFFVSPGDPAFYLHHSQIDRVWWIWQNLNISERFGAKGIAGTGTFLNMPPSPDTTLDTPIEMSYATGKTGTGSQRMRDLMSTVAGPFCYIYL